MLLLLADVDANEIYLYDITWVLHMQLASIYVTVIVAGLPAGLLVEGAVTHHAKMKTYDTTAHTNHLLLYQTLTHDNTFCVCVALDHSSAIEEYTQQPLLVSTTSYAVLKHAYRLHFMHSLVLIRVESSR
jgi:hypothetical protein